MAVSAMDALDWDSDDEALMQEAKAQGCRQLTLVFVIIAAALVCALAACLLSLASCRADWADYYKRQEEAAAAAACAYCEDELDATDVRVVSVEARGLPEWRVHLQARDAIRGYGGDVCGSVPRPRDRSGARRMDWWGFPQAA